jgi:hypothetical protein
MSPDRRAVQCNLRQATKVFPAGARAYVVTNNPGWGHERIAILGRSHSGRWVEKWEPISRLRDFRVKTLPAEHPLYDHRRIWTHGDVELLCERLAEAARYWISD